VRKITLLFLFVLLITTVVLPVEAQSNPNCVFNPDGTITCTVSGGNDDGNGNGNGNEELPLPDPISCAPSEVRTAHLQVYEPEAGGTCTMIATIIDQCSGEVMEAGDIEYGVACPAAAAPPANQPCQILIVNAGGVSCDTGSGWSLKARVGFPENYLDVRPYPATLVRWPTAIRNGGQPESSGSGRVGYIANGGGSSGNPVVGDWRNLTLTLTLRPAGPLEVDLPRIGKLSLSNQGATGNPQIFQWEVPSHPAVGAGPLTGSVAGLEELPADMPLFVGHGHSAYKLFWNLSYDEYEAIKGCVPGPNGNGVYNCGGGTGHKDIVGYDWKHHSNGGEIPPSAVANLPASLKADLNSDGTPDAYWDNNLTLQRMDESGSISNPQYQHSWNWGGTIYWAVREGQGQIGWPDK